VYLRFDIEQGTPIKVDTVAVLKTQGLTGIAYVELSGGTKDSAPLLATAAYEYPVIRTKPSLSARLENVLTTVLAKLDSTTGSVNAILSDENRAAFTSALADIATLAHTLAERKDTLDAGLADAARTFKNASRATAQVGPMIERIERSADAVEKMGNEVAATSTSAGKTVDSVGADLTRFSAETLPELERLLGELRVLSTSLRRLSQQTERDPRGLLFGRQPALPGPGETSQ
jgi:phospholipid/cholesterol/gamma-HCH transport system substrate-binding protein